jgi:lysozyme
MVTKFLDISKWEGTIDFKKIREQTDIKGIIARASYNQTKDQMFDAYWPEIMKYNFISGTFHYFYNYYSATAQADVYYNIIKNSPGDSIWIDVEDSTYLPGDLYARVLTFLARLQSYFPSRQLGIYTRAEYWNTYIGNRKEFRKYKLWIAQYNGFAPTIPLPWFPGEQIFWQFSEKGKDYFTTGEVDLNVSSLIEDQLRYKTPI